MQGLIFPIIMLAVTLIGGSFLLLYIKYSNKNKKRNEEIETIKTAQEFINVKDIKDKYLYTNDNMIMMFIRIHSVSIDLYSKTEKNTLIKTLTAELSDIQYPFKFIALSRPVDISSLISDMSEMLKYSDDKRKELLRQEISEMSGYALSGEIVERQFFISVWYKFEDGIEREIHKRASLLCEKFVNSSIVCEILTEKEIVRLLNLINNPSYTHLEDSNFEASIPILQEE